MLSYWKAPNAPVERVYLQIAPNRRIYGQRVNGNRVAWRGDDMDHATAESTAKRAIGSLPSWSDLRRMAENAVECRTESEVPLSPAPVPSPVTPRRETPAHRQPAAASADTKPVRIDTAYGTRDSQKLDAYALGALTVPTRIVVDPQEPPEIASLLSKVGNLSVEVAPLRQGRYLVEDCLTVDRISTHDLHRGIADDPRALLERVSALSEVDHATLFIVEGGIRSHRRAPLDKIDGALTYVSVVHRIPVVDSIDVWESLYLIVRAIGHACQPLGDGLTLPPHRRSGRKDHRVSPRYVLEGIPGISEVRAELVLEHYGTLAQVACATVEDLLAVPNLGPTVAQAIYDAFHTR